MTWLPGRVYLLEASAWVRGAPSSQCLRSLGHVCATLSFQWVRRASSACAPWLAARACLRKGVLEGIRPCEASVEMLVLEHTLELESSSLRGRQDLISSVSSGKL